MRTCIIVDSKLMAYTASFQRKEPILATLVSIEQAIKHMVDVGEVTGEYFVVMGYDFGKSRYRENLIDSYKGHRTEGVARKSDAEQLEYDYFQHQYRYVLPKMTEALGVRTLGVQGVEFDDLGSIIANKFVGKVVILSEDHDMLQITLDKPLVRQFMPRTYRMLDTEGAIAEEGVTSKLEFLVAKAVKGDYGDAIKGLKQCGDLCFDEWFEQFRGKYLSKSKWKEKFLALANSKKKYVVHQDYIRLGITTFEEVFELNLKLGETMVDHSLLNDVEQHEFNECISKDRNYDKSKVL